MVRRLAATPPVLWQPALWLLAALVFDPGSATAQVQDQNAAERELRSIERALELDRERQEELQDEAAALAGEVEAVRREMVETARVIQDREAEATALESELAQLSAQEAATSERLEERRGQLVGTIGALQRMAQRPPEALIAMPASPVDTLRSALLLRAVVPGLETDARQLREDVATLRQVRSETAAKREALEKTLDNLETKRTELANLQRRKDVARERAEAERRDVTGRLARMAQEATDLRDLLRRLEAERKAAEAAAQARAAEAARRQLEEARRRSAEATRRLNESSRQSALNSTTPLEEAQPAALRAAPPSPEPERRPPGKPPTQGGLLLPAQGRIVSGFGEGSGSQSLGITIETRSDGQVVAPYDGRVAYAGPFRGYGLLLIITHGGGYHSLLTGLSRLDCTPGQWVLAGEPVGVMATSASGDTKLYVELRHNGQPINPIPWLTARRG